MTQRYTFSLSDLGSAPPPATHHTHPQRRSKIERHRILTTNTCQLFAALHSLYYLVATTCFIILKLKGECRDWQEHDDLSAHFGGSPGGSHHRRIGRCLFDAVGFLFDETDITIKHSSSGILSAEQTQLSHQKAPVYELRLCSCSRARRVVFVVVDSDRALVRRVWQGRSSRLQSSSSSLQIGYQRWTQCTGKLD